MWSEMVKVSIVSSVLLINNNSERSELDGIAQGCRVPRYTTFKVLAQVMYKELPDPFFSTLSPQYQIKVKISKRHVAEKEKYSATKAERARRWSSYVTSHIQIYSDSSPRRTARRDEFDGLSPPSDARLYVDWFVVHSAKQGGAADVLKGAIHSMKSLTVTSRSPSEVYP